MALVIVSPKVRCPNCGTIDKAEVHGAGCAFWLLNLLVYVLGFVFWPLFVFGFLLTILLLVKPAKLACRKCKFPNPIPLTDDEYRSAVGKSNSEQP